MVLNLINLGMTISVLCFLVGLYLRKRNNFIHRIVNLTGVCFNLITAVYLLLIKYFFGGLEKAGMVAIVDRWVVDTHRFFALISLVLMLFMTYTGIKKNTKLHKKISFVFFPLYIIIFLSGLIIFKNG